MAWTGLRFSRRGISLSSACACALSLSLCSPLAFFSSCRFTEPFSGYVKERDEVLRVIAHLEERMKRKVVAIAGHSKGATVACLAASDYASNPNKFDGAVAAISGRHDMRQGVERSIGRKVVSSVMATREPQLVEIAKRRPFWLTAERLEERASVDMDAVLRGMGESVPLLVIHGDRDERIPVAEAQAYADSRAMAAPEVAPEVHVVAGADHCFTKQQDRERMAALCSRFVRKVGEARVAKKA